MYKILVWAFGAMALIGLALALAPASTVPPDVLVIEHTYDGTTERAGYLVSWQYTAGHMLVEFADGGDGIFRNGFEQP